MKNTFYCPLCKKEVEIGEWAKMSQSYPPYEYRLSNKRYHMKTHKKVKVLKNKISMLNKRMMKYKEELQIIVDVFGKDMRY